MLSPYLCTHLTCVPNCPHDTCKGDKPTTLRDVFNIRRISQPTFGSKLSEALVGFLKWMQGLHFPG